MNIHYLPGAKGVPVRISAVEARACGLSIGSGKGTEPPRTRSGQTYPGGKHRRKALANLARRHKGYLEDVALRQASSPGTVAGLRKPGSMKHN